MKSGYFLRDFIIDSCIEAAELFEETSITIPITEGLEYGPFNKTVAYDQISLIAYMIAHGLNIPHYCYHNELAIVGNCRVCIVELTEAKKPIMACTTDAELAKSLKEIGAFNDSPLVSAAREGVLEFLLLNHPLDCPICDQGGDCDLQDISLFHGSDSRRFFEAKRHVTDKNLGPIVNTVMTRCIHCTRCVRFMNDIAGSEELGMLGRGEKSEIGTFIEKPLLSELSGNIIDLCPVGRVYTDSDYLYIYRDRNYHVDPLGNTVNYPKPYWQKSDSRNWFYENEPEALMTKNIIETSWIIEKGLPYQQKLKDFLTQLEDSLNSWIAIAVDFSFQQVVEAFENFSNMFLVDLLVVLDDRVVFFYNGERYDILFLSHTGRAYLLHGGNDFSNYYFDVFGYFWTYNMSYSWDYVSMYYCAAHAVIFSIGFGFVLIRPTVSSIWIIFYFLIMISGLQHSIRKSSYIFLLICLFLIQYYQIEFQLDKREEEKHSKNPLRSLLIYLIYMGSVSSFLAMSYYVERCKDAIYEQYIGIWYYSQTALFFFYDMTKPVHPILSLYSLIAISCLFCFYPIRQPPNKLVKRLWRLLRESFDFLFDNLDNIYLTTSAAFFYSISKAKFPTELYKEVIKNYQESHLILAMSLLRKWKKKKGKIKRSLNYETYRLIKIVYVGLLSSNKISQYFKLFIFLILLARALLLLNTSTEVMSWIIVVISFFFGLIFFTIGAFKVALLISIFLRIVSEKAFELFFYPRSVRILPSINKYLTRENTVTFRTKRRIRPFLTPRR